MKKTIIILCVALTSWSSFSQHSEKREKIRSLKVAFITERLGLTETEAQKFWPIYNAYESKKDEQRRMGYDKHKQISEDMTEAQAKAMLKDLIAFEKEREHMRSNYIESLLKVMPAKKIIKLKFAEEEFNRKMLHEYKKRHSNDGKD
ncbi:sensor of ECF-type sigma factor [Gelidibacter salicanalis]|uniref:Sensor of ECF-type sigma factor n=1 Tax=Gelidibacter salicanalis TaxID=291193 RepID=A0A5C7APH5_9FLAO|nr:sensor of ECF-type sigma factor [Gelidibacter salicanalis]TXE10670.1 sensor of ECF-type sigma factor [Gelidibacter salicanalis]